MKENISQVPVVDDERVIADTLAAILNHAGFKCTAVYSGADAVREALRWKPDVMVRCNHARHEWYRRLD